MSHQKIDYLYTYRALKHVVLSLNQCAMKWSLKMWEDLHIGEVKREKHSLFAPKKIFFKPIIKISFSKIPQNIPLYIFGICELYLSNLLSKKN